MKGITRWIFNLFGAYNLVVGVIAVFAPSVTASLYAVSQVTPEFFAASRWIGALAIAIAYGAFTAAKTGSREMVNLVAISAVAAIVASILSIMKGDAAFGNMVLDFIFQAALIIVLVVKGKDIV